MLCTVSCYKSVLLAGWFETEGSRENYEASDTESGFQLRGVFFFLVALQPNASHGLLIHEVSRSHTTTHHSR